MATYRFEPHDFGKHRGYDHPLRNVHLVAVEMKEEQIENGVMLYHFALFDEQNGAWEDTFTTSGQAQEYLRGVKAGMCLAGKSFQDFPASVDEMKWKGQQLPDPLDAAAESGIMESPY